MDHYWDKAVDLYWREIAVLLRLIEGGWVLCDDRDEVDHLVVVDEGRNTHAIVRPAKPLVTKLVEKGLIEYEDWSDRPGDERQYIPVPSGYTGPPRGPDPVPFVYSFRVTADGLQFAAR